MESEMIKAIALEICANIDEGDACTDLCGTCIRQAEAALRLVKSYNRDVKRIKALEVMLLEVLEIAARNEDGDYIERARDVLFNVIPIRGVVKNAASE